MLLNIASKVFFGVILEQRQDHTAWKTGRGASGVWSWPKLYGPNSNAEDYCGTKHRVAVLPVDPLYRFREGLR